MTYKTPLVADQEQRILEMLSKQEYNINELAELLDLGYYTVRKHINTLLTLNKVVLTHIDNRRRYYAVNTATVNTAERIPYIKSIISRQKHKAIDLIEAVGSEDSMQSVTACRDIPRLMVLLMDAAYDASVNKDVKIQLESVRKQMQRHFLTLKNSSHIYEQLLSDPRFWDSDYLAKMVDDADYKHDAIQNAMDYYRKRDSNG